MQNKTALSKQAFDAQAETYDTNIKGQHARNLYPYMLQEIIHIYGDVVLDMGCGTGALMQQVYAEDHQRHLYGIDLSTSMLDKAKKRMADNAELFLGDASQLPFADNSFDLVYCNDSFHHYPYPKKVIQEVYRVLKLGGVFLIGDCYQSLMPRMIMNAWMHFSKEGDVKIYSRREMTRLLQPYFYDIKWKKVNGQAMIMKGVK